MSISILYEDRHLIVCEKPIGVLSEEAGSEKSEDSMVSLLNAFLTQKGEKGAVRPLHRLDRQVGGVMVYAKTPKAAAAMSALIAEGGMKKEYAAVCHGDAAASLGSEGELVDLLFRDAAKNKTYVTKRLRRGVKEARLFYRVAAVKDTPEGTMSLLSLTLGTGRTHQIRVQFSSRRHALVGDGKYGSRSNRCEAALFARRLTFVHPITGKTLCPELARPKGYPWDFFESEELP